MKMISRRGRGGNVPSELLSAAFRRYRRHYQNYSAFLGRNNFIALNSFDDVFHQMSDHDCLCHLRFLKADVLRILPIVCTQSDEFLTKRNRYSCTPLLATCVVLSRLATPYRWHDRETFFKKHAPQLSEIYWEAMDAFVDEHEHLITGPLHAPFIAERAEMYAKAVEDRTGCLDNCIGFIDGTNIQIARPGTEGLQRVVYNGHKRFHALKFQAVVCPDGILLHGYGPVEGRRHDWTLYTRSDLDTQFEECLIIDGKQYCIYGDSGYNGRIYLLVPCQGLALTEDQKAFNLAMATGRITVEWLFKELKMYWTVMHFSPKLKVLQAPVGTMYIAKMLVHNFRSCLYGNQI